MHGARVRALGALVVVVVFTPCTARGRVVSCVVCFPGVRMRGRGRGVSWFVCQCVYPVWTSQA